MKITVNGETIELEDVLTVNDLIESRRVIREAILVSVNGEIAVEESTLSDGDVVELISVVSGG